MRRRKSPTRAVAALCALLLAVGSPLHAKMEVQANRQSDVDFATYKTFAWRLQDYPAGHALEEGSVADRLIRSTAEDLLAASGFERVDADPDLFITYTGAVRDQMTREGVNLSLGGNVSWVGDPNQQSARWNRVGTLAIHVIDADSDEVVWSGWASDVAHSPDKMRKKAERAVRRILRLFPPD